MLRSPVRTMIKSYTPSPEHLRASRQERRTGDLPVVEGKHLGAYDLVRLVTFARDHHDVAGAGVGQRALYRDLPVGRRRCTVAARGTGRDSGDDLGDDGLGLLAPWIVRRDPEPVGDPCRDPAHQRALAAI